MAKASLWPPLIIALVADFLDWVFLPADLPIIGDAIDFVAIALLYHYIGSYALIGALEFIPLEDPVPTFTAIVIYWWYSRGKKMGGGI